MCMRPAGVFPVCLHPEPVANCRPCVLAESDRRYQDTWSRPVRSFPRPPGRSGDGCVYEGAELSSREAASLGLNPDRKWLRCVKSNHPRGEVVCKCRADSCGKSCPGYRPESAPLIPLTAVKVGTPPVVGRDRGEFFNGSIVRYRGRVLMAYRFGWKGSQIHVVELDPRTWSPVGPATLIALTHKESAYGREDPRLFVHRDRLHVSYTGVVVKRRVGTVTNVLYARLRDNLSVESIHAPHYADRRAWEKNWVFFQGASGDLLAVYSVSPHVVLRIDGDTATEVARTETRFPWNGGELRGGAPPVFHRGQWYHWFHGRIGQWTRGRYTLGLYTFQPGPPYAVTWMTPTPCVTGDPATRPKDQSHEPAVIFPGGSVIDGSRWHVSSGVHDRWCEIHSFDLEEVTAVAEGN